VLLLLGMADRRERLWVHGALVAGVAAIVTAGLLLVNFLDHPYKEHTGSIEPTEMRQSLGMASAQTSGVRSPCREDGRSL
jgi:hypothetical protein